MTYNYDEFMSQFAGADKLPEYACGGKTKVKKACGGKKIAVSQNGNKVKKNVKSSVNDDANDDAAVRPGEKAPDWLRNQGQPTQTKQENMFDTFRNTAKKISDKTNKLIKRKK